MALPFDLNKPDPGNPEWGPDVTAIRDNLASLAMYAGANGGRLPDWDSQFTYTSGDLTQVELTNKTYPLVKIKIEYVYSGGNLSKEKIYFDEGLGAGYELVSNGVLTYNYVGGDLDTVTAANT